MPRCGFGFPNSAGGQLQITAVLRIITLAKIGKVWRRSTMPATDATRPECALGWLQDNHVILFFISLYINSGSR
jgi:hypothetical protein